MGLFNSNSSLVSVSQDVIAFINLLVWVLSALAVVIFFWGLVRYIYKSDDTKAQQEGRSSILWSLIALFVLFSIFGILQILNVAFFGGSISGNPNAPPGGSGSGWSTPNAAQSQYGPGL